MLYTLIITVCTMQGAVCDDYIVDTDLTATVSEALVTSYMQSPCVVDVILQAQPKKV